MRVCWHMGGAMHADTHAQATALKNVLVDVSFYGLYALMHSVNIVGFI